MWRAPPKSNIDFDTKNNLSFEKKNIIFQGSSFLLILFVKFRWCTVWNIISFRGESSWQFAFGGMLQALEVKSCLEEQKQRRGLWKLRVASRCFVIL